MKTKALASYDQLILATKRGSYHGPVPKRVRDANKKARLLKRSRAYVIFQAALFLRLRFLRGRLASGWRDCLGSGRFRGGHGDRVGLQNLM